MDGMHKASQTSEPARGAQSKQPVRCAATKHRAMRPIDIDAYYQAVCTKDSTFDGYFFVGVSSTGIYCRPICRVKTPKQQHCRFFSIAAQAEAAGFRPCMRCRPELAPADRYWSSEDASDILARKAASIIDGAKQHDGSPKRSASSMTDIANLLGISDRHLRRVFENYWGVSPLQYRQTQRLLRAKQLLVDSQLPISRVAALAGFSSLRRFNDSFHNHYRLSPSKLRANNANERTGSPDHSITLRLDYRPPFDVQAMLNFWRIRSLNNLELIGAHDLFRTLAIVHPASPSRHLVGWVHCCFDPLRPLLSLTISESLLPAIHGLVGIVRAAFDLDADPALIDASLSTDFPASAGLRLPGAFDGFELAVRAVIGQQVSVAAARTFAQRIVDRFGTRLRLVSPPHQLLDTNKPKLEQLRLFPRPQILAQASSDALGALGIVRQRQVAIVSLAKAMVSGAIRLDPVGDDKQAIRQTVQQLCDLPGFGEWTAQYIAMRALKYSDALPAGDVALHRALGLHGEVLAKRQTLERSKAWMPWRSYAVIRAWHSLAQAASC